MKFEHIPVLAGETIDALCIRPEGIYFDGTLGGGSHSGLICKRLKTGRLIGVDRDKDALKAARDHLAVYNDRITLVHDNFKNVNQILNTLQIKQLDGALLDLGVSSYQLDEPERGFSYRLDAPLDMRMDRENSLSAEVIVNEYSEKALAEIIFKYGEDRNARRIAKKIVENRPIKTTLELVDVIKTAFTVKERYEGKHPAKRTFQAIRIEANAELDKLDTALCDLANKLRLGGRLAVITFHSLEQTIVKNTFNKLASSCTCPKDFPICVCGEEQQFKIITKKPIAPSEKELSENPRAASARLKVIEKI